MLKTSLSDPLHIAAVSPPDLPGVIGMTLCPGKKDPGRGWERDLDIDADAIRGWGAEIVVTLVEDHEFDLLDVRRLPDAVERRRMKWAHLPIRDVSVPDAKFEAAWATAGLEFRECSLTVRAQMKIDRAERAQLLTPIVGTSGDQPLASCGPCLY
jgi:ADP-ribosyl-[dinitrogen reductase] hydrolase